MTSGSRATAGILVVAAFDPELEPFRRELGIDVGGRIGERYVVAQAVGIGLPDAAVGAARRLADCGAPVVVMIGTCGAYAGAPLGIGSTIASRRIVLGDSLALAGSAQYPGPMRTALDADARLVAAMSGAGATAADVATTLAITVDDGAAALVRQGTGAAVEHLEAFAVAVACARADARFVAVLGVANTVGSRARDEWKAHHVAASAAAASIVARWLRAGAPGAGAEEG